MFFPSYRKSISTVNELQAKECSTKRAHSEATFTSRSKTRGHLSICSMDQGNWTKPDRDGGH